MSYQIPSSSLNLQDDDGSSSGGEEDRLSDWASSLGEALQTKSLFSDRTFPNPEAALASDFKEHGFDLKAESQRKNLDLYGKMRLINWIRREVGHALCSTAGVQRGLRLMSRVQVWSRRKRSVGRRNCLPMKSF